MFNSMWHSFKCKNAAIFNLSRTKVKIAPRLLHVNLTLTLFALSPPAVHV